MKNNVNEFIFSSMNDGKTKITLGDGTINISRPGMLAKLSHGFSGEKTILIQNISAVQIKKAGISRGYIQFIMSGANEVKSGVIFGKKDENIVYFDSGFNNNQTNENAEKIKEYIENYNLNNQSNQTVVKQEVSKYDELKKLKELLDEKIISQEEFEKEKSKILS